MIAIVFVLVFFPLYSLRWPASSSAVCCPWCSDSGWCSLCGSTFLRWSWPQLWLSPEVQLLTVGPDTFWPPVTFYYSVISAFWFYRGSKDHCLFNLFTFCVKSYVSVVISIIFLVFQMFIVTRLDNKTTLCKHAEPSYRIFCSVLFD